MVVALELLQRVPVQLVAELDGVDPVEVALVHLDHAAQKRAGLDQDPRREAPRVLLDPSRLDSVDGGQRPAA